MRDMMPALPLGALLKILRNLGCRHSAIAVAIEFLKTPDGTRLNFAKFDLAVGIAVERFKSARRRGYRGLIRLPRRCKRQSDESSRKQEISSLRHCLLQG
jgi:hypothetical protein